MPKREKCQRCGWMDGKSFHICIDPSAPVMVSEPAPIPTLSKDHRRRISESKKKQWASTNAARNTEIVERYSRGDISYKGLAEEFKVGLSTINNVMRSAKKAGVIDVRPRGTNIKHGG